MIMVVIIHIANYYCRAFNDIDKISYLGALIFNTISRISVPFFFMISGATLLSKKYDNSKNIGPWTDIYGICATLYCMMTGDVPPASYERSEKDELIDIAQYTISIDKKVAAAIMKGLSMEPADRQQSIEELYKGLYGATPDEKNNAQVQEESFLMKDGTGRIWFGEYPMNEIVGKEVTSDLIYGEYNSDDVTVINGEK